MHGKLCCYILKSIAQFDLSVIFKITFTVLSKAEIYMLLNFLSFMYLPFIILYRKAKSQSKMSKLHTYISSSGTIWYLHLLGYHISPWKNPPFHILQFVYQSAAMSIYQSSFQPFCFSNQTVQDDTQIFHYNFQYSFRSADLYWHCYRRRLIVF